MYRATIENHGDSSYHATAGGFGFVMDTEGRGVGPVDALLASLCACVGHYVRDFLRLKAIEPIRFTVESSAESTADGTRLGDIDVRIQLMGPALDPKLRQELLVFVEKCKIHSSLKTNSKITKTVECVG